MKRASLLVFSCLVACLVLSVGVANAGGFALYEWGNRSIAMATTGYAIRGDASVIATNPALMTKHQGGEVYAGGTFITPHSDIKVGTANEATKNRTYLVPHAYYTQQMESNENVWLGVGVFTRFGLGTHYPQGWAGASDLQYVDLGSISLNPNIAFKFNDSFSMAFGVEVLKGGITLERQVGGQKYWTRTNGYAVGGNVGLHYTFDEQWSAGFTYRAPMKMFTSGRAESGALGNGDQNIEAWLPSSFTLGVGYQPTDKWSIEFDTIFTRWELTDEMVYSGVLNTTDRLDYKNAWRFQLGTEYWFTDWFAGRLGYVYDVTPTVNYEASYMLPANDRQLFSTGVGFKVDDFKIDWSFMYVKTKERTGLEIGGNDVEFKNGKTWITGLSVGYEF